MAGFLELSAFRSCENCQAQDLQDHQRLRRGAGGEKGGSLHFPSSRVLELECHTAQAMKNFSQWEAREERRLHKDLQRHQKGVLFLGDPPREPAQPDTDTGVIHVPDLSTVAQRSRSSRSRDASQQTPFADVKGKRPAAAPLPGVPEGTPAAGPSRLDVGGAGRGASKDVLAGVDVPPLPGVGKPGRLSTAPAELPSNSRSHAAPHHPAEGPGAPPSGCNGLPR